MSLGCGFRSPKASPQPIANGCLEWIRKSSSVLEETSSPAWDAWKLGSAHALSCGKMPASDAVPWGV